MADTGQTAHAGQSISVKVEGSNIQITLHGQVQGQSRAVGWGAVEDAVQKDDERQVQSCKEDIDSLLTFAGLYSAALTALLALSFAMLQEDTAGESLQVLRQIALQTATYQLLPGGGLNSTAAIPPPSSSPFEPSRAALRVNILWFASLVFSLSTASIGILVKQWLRAYVSYQTSSAQGRMRVRYFRHQGMEIWKVYEIAAILPFFIQLALGLFFVGLCYFTAGVHADLGHATLPLVVGWALFVFVVTILPIFSSHCPYKPAMFEGLFSVIRPRLFSSMEASCVLLYRFARGPLTYVRGVVVSTLALGWTANELITRTLAAHIGQLLEEDGALLGRFLQGTSSYIKVVSVSARAKVFSTLALGWTAVDLVSRTLGAHIYHLVSESPPESDLKKHTVGRLALQARKRTSHCADSDRPYDEADAVKFGGKDAEVLVFADALQSDDELLGTAVVDALKQTQSTLENIAVFVVGVLRSRDITELNVEDEPPTTPLDCRSLTPRAATAIADVVAHHHNLIRHDAPPRACRWVGHALLSLPRPLPAGSLFLDMLTLYDEDSNVWEFQIRRMLERSSKPPDQSVRLVLSAFKLFWISKYLPSHTADPGSKILRQASDCVSELLGATLSYAGLSDVNLSEDDIDESLARRMPFNNFPLQDTIEWLAGLVRQEVESKREDIDAMAVRNALELILRLSHLDLISRSYRHELYDWMIAFGDLPGWDIQASLIRDCSKYCIENSIEGLQWATRCYAQCPYQIIQIYNLTLKRHVHFADEDALQCLYHVIADFDINDVLRSDKSSACACICYIIVDILTDAPHEEVTAPVARLWRRLFRRVTLMLPDPNESQRLPDNTKHLVSVCLYFIVDRLDRGAQYRRCSNDDEIKKQEWWNQFKPDDSPFSNHFVFLLSRLLSEEARAQELRRCWRLQMVEDMFKEDKDAVLKDDEHDDDEGVSEQKGGEGGSAQPVTDEGTDGGARSRPEQTAAGQNGLSEAINESRDANMLDGEEPQLIAPPMLAETPVDASNSGVAGDASDHLAAKSPLAHPRSSDVGDPEQVNSEASDVDPAGNADVDISASLGGLRETGGRSTKANLNISDSGERQREAAAGILGETHGGEARVDENARDYSTADASLGQAGDPDDDREHVTHEERGVKQENHEEVGENRQSLVSEGTVDEFAEAKRSDGGSELRNIEPPTVTGNSGLEGVP